MDFQRNNKMMCTVFRYEVAMEVARLQFNSIILFLKQIRQIS